jgi:hypothetical protein
MEPIREFRLCHRNGFGFYMIIVLWLIASSCHVNTRLDDQFNMPIRINCAAVLIGKIQVHSLPLKLLPFTAVNILKQKYYFTDFPQILFSE